MSAWRWPSSLPVLVAGLFGLFNGWLITRFRIQPIIATLVLFIAGRGIAQVLTNGDLQVFKTPEFQFIGLGRVLGIPFQVWIMAVIVIVAAWALRRTVFGRQVLAIGGNEAAARLSGVPVARVKLLVYGISGLLRRHRRADRDRDQLRPATPTWSGSAWSSTRSPPWRSAARCSPAAAPPSSARCSAR